MFTCARAQSGCSVTDLYTSQESHAPEMLSVHAIRVDGKHGALVLPTAHPWHSRKSSWYLRSRSDSGGASFLGDVWTAMQEWRESAAWRPVSVPALDLQHYEATLAVGGPAELRPPALPDRPPLVPDDASPAEVG